ncbi:MAG: IS200/IS605 family transposase [Gemmataceae bacterium]|nr:IS200/IS605 family transposase [Gemmataceae bacterium]
MAQTYHKLLYHLVFSTKYRAPLIEPDWRPDLHAFIGGIVRERRGELLAAGGIPDHIHLLVRLAADRAVSDVVRDIKSVSSGWRHEGGDMGFAWQGGYGAFTVSPSVVPDVIVYIDRQEEHHRKRDFQDEFRALFVKHGIEYDERYLWD